MDCNSWRSQNWGSSAQAFDRDDRRDERDVGGSPDSGAEDCRRPERILQSVLHRRTSVSFAFIELLLCAIDHLQSFLKKKWANPGLFFIYFRLFKRTLQFWQQINVKKCPSSIWRQDLDSQPSGYNSPPLTTRPGLPPIIFLFLLIVPWQGLTFFSALSFAPNIQHKENRLWFWIKFQSNLFVREP